MASKQAFAVLACHIITDSFKIDPIDTSLLCTSLICSQKEAHPTLVSWRELSCRDDANAWRKSTKEADKHKNFLLQFRK